ncbi:hypothetical protein [Desulfothermus sp.]
MRMQILEPCTIGDKELSPGDIIEVVTSLAQRLIDKGIGRPLYPGQSEDIATRGEEEAPTVRELKELLKRHPVKIDLREGIENRVRLIEPPGGAYAIWKAFQRISHLVYFDEQVSEWLARYDGQIIDLYRQGRQKVVEGTNTVSKR